MALPKAVQEQIAAAKELHRQAYPDQPSEGGNTGDPAPDAGVDPGGDQPQADDPKAGQDPSGIPQQAGLEPGQGLPPKGDTAPGSDHESLKVEFEKLKARYETLKGKYDAEPGRLQGENSALAREVAALKEQVSRLTAASGDHTPAAEEKKPVPAGAKTAYQTWFEENYGEEHWEEHNQHIQSQIADKIGGLQKTVDSVATVTAQSASDRYYQALDGKVPEWEIARDDPRFIPFLKERIPGTSITRFDAAKAAEDGRDADTVAEHYTEFIKRHPDIVKTAAKSGSKVAPAKPGKEGLVAPRSTPGGAGSGPKDKTEVQWVKASDIKMLAIEKATTKRWHGRDAEYNAIKATHQAAIAANRVLADQ